MSVNSIRELTEEDFARAVKNPHFDKLMTKVEVAVTKEDFATFEELARINGISVQIMMRSCLADFAKEVREED